MSYFKQGRGFAYPDYEPQWPPEPPFELLSVRARVKVDLENRSIEGSAVNVFRALDGIDVLQLHARDMDIRSVRVDGAVAKYFYDGDVLEVHLPRSYQRGEAFEVQVDYRAVRPKAGVWFVPTDVEGPARLAYTQGQPEDTRFWLPTYDYPNRKTTVELTVIAPSGLQVVANGTLTSKRVEGGLSEWVFRLDSRIPTYLIAFAVGDFTVVEESFDGVLLQYVVPRGREADIERSFRYTKEMIRFFEDFTGVKYPYPKYAQVCVDEFVAGGMENASVTILTSATLHDEKAHVDYRSEPLVSHELAHQWFGDLVTCRDWSHLWLNESFATLMEALWRRRELGEDEFVYDLIGMLDSYLGEYERYSRPIVTRTYRYAEELFDAHSYPKGALVLWTLMNLVGEQVFRRGVNLYLTRRREDNADTDDLRKAMEEASGRRLDWFFEQFVQNSGHPSLTVSWKWSEKEGLLELRVSQSQGEDSLPRYMLTLEVEFVGDGWKIRRAFEISEKSHYFPVKLPSQPKAVCVDPDFKLFKALSLDVGPEELVNIIRNCGKLYPRVVAVRELGKKGGARHVDELGKVLLDEAEFWGLRAEAADALRRIGGDSAARLLLDSLATVKHPRVRRAVVRALSGFRGDRFGKALAEVLRNPEESYYVRAEAAIAVAKTRYSQAFEELKKALEYPSHNHVIAASALEGLGLLGTEEALEVILPYTEPEKPLQLRTAALRALGYFAPSPRVLDVLEQASRSQHPHIRTAVVVAATRSLSPRYLGILEALRGDVSGSVARRARDAIEQIKKSMERGEEYRKLREELDKLAEEERRLAERVEKLEKRGA
ncbi:M1 family aminopeptidase [Infirmifilum sp. NZ]|uniref:M1 family aminopeptidase n=1 Tax=Infirmifilum sp. NZ TaxID=2926850 RepID=UPI0027A15C78|nr:M1 family aminopeptidase [Infirmifilum sp. NZ]UNQ73656.1 HEAT repeat domain-containing protein [Infirmifilum sp. NZ]